MPGGRFVEPIRVYAEHDEVVRQLVEPVRLYVPGYGRHRVRPAMDLPESAEGFRGEPGDAERTSDPQPVAGAARIRPP